MTRAELYRRYREHKAIRPQSGMKHPRYILEGIIRCFRKHGQPYDEATLIRGLYKQQMKLMAIEIGGWPALRRMERTLA